MKKTVTIVGSTGFIGKRLVEFYVQKGVDVILPQKNDTSIFDKNLGNIIYCAGYTADWIHHPHEMIEAHVTYLSKILSNANFEHLTYLSSTRLYDDTDGIKGLERDHLRLNPNKQRHLYDLSKALGECLCLSTQPNRTAIARLSCVYGFDTDAPGYLSELLRSAANRPLELTSDSAGEIVRDYIYIDDVISSLHEISCSMSQGIINVASGMNVSNYDLRNILLNYKINIKFQNKLHGIKSTLCDTNKLNSLNVFPRSVKDIICLRWGLEC